MNNIKVRLYCRTTCRRMLADWHEMTVFGMTQFELLNANSRWYTINEPWAWPSGPPRRCRRCSRESGSGGRREGAACEHACARHGAQCGTAQTSTTAGTNKPPRHKSSFPTVEGLAITLLHSSRGARIRAELVLQYDHVSHARAFIRESCFFYLFTPPPTDIADHRWQCTSPQSECALARTCLRWTSTMRSTAGPWTTLFDLPVSDACDSLFRLEVDEDCGNGFRLFRRHRAEASYSLPFAAEVILY